MLNLSFD